MRPECFELGRETDIVRFLEGLSAERRAMAVAQLGEAERAALDHDWRSWAHDGQAVPEVGGGAAGAAASGDWQTWVIMAGRGFGKTRAGAEWVLGAARPSTSLGTGPSTSAQTSENVRIALVAATADEARRVMVEGESGLLAVAEPWIEAWNPSLRRLSFAGGAEAFLYSGASPEALRGPQHHLAWCDELAKWKKPVDTWNMLRLGLRLGERPRALVTTTPRPGPALSGIMALPGTRVSRGPTRANPHLAESFVEAVHADYAGTRLARQELEGELLPDAAGALWTVELIERCRAGAGSGSGAGFARLAIGVDPPAADGTCGIVACALDVAGRGHVLADHSVSGRSPEGWARAVAAAAEAWGALHPGVPVVVVAEGNQGGRMVESVLRAASASLRVKRVHAAEGKSARADPVAALFEGGRVAVRGSWPELEAQLCGLIGGGGYEGPGASPDRADAMVWAMSELMLGPAKAQPRVRGL